MKKIFISLTVMLLIFSSSSVFGQDLTMYNMTNLRLSKNNNPARQTDCKVFIGLPIFSSTYLNLENTGFAYKNFFTEIPNAPEDQRYKIDIDKFYNALSPVNHVNLESQIALINIGFRVKDYQITFDINNKISQRFSYPQSVFNIKDGTYYEDGRTLDFSNFGEDFTAYNEIGIGVSKEVIPGLTVGGKIKYLIGLSNFSTKKFNLNWETSTADTSNYAYTFNTAFDFRMSSPVTITETFDPETGLPNGMEQSDELENLDPSFAGIKPYLFPKNRGWGIDLGAIYEINKFEFSASLIDLGYINWKNNAKIISTEESEFVFSGANLSKYVTNYGVAKGLKDSSGAVIEAFVDDMLDTLISLSNPNFEDKSYITGLNTKIYVGANYHFTNWFDVGLLYRGSVYKNKLHSAFTTSANINFWKGWSYSLAHTMQYKTYNNIGMGLAYKIGPFQWYAISDNMALPIYALSDTKMANNLIKGTKQYTFHIGFNITFGCYSKIDKGLLD